MRIQKRSMKFLKSENEENDSIFLRMRDGTRNLLRGWNASSKVQLMYLEGLKQRETYGWWFWKLIDIEKDSRNDFTGSKTLSKVETMYLVLKLIEA